MLIQINEANIPETADNLIGGVPLLSFGSCFQELAEVDKWYLKA